MCTCGPTFPGLLPTSLRIVRLHVGSAVFDTVRRPLIIGVLGDVSPMDSHRLGLRAKESLSHGADLVEVQGDGHDGAVQACRGLASAGVLWTYATDSLRDAVDAVDAGAVAIYWLGAARDLTEMPDAATSATFMSSGPHQAVGSHWWVTTWPYHRLPPGDDDQPRVTVVDLAGETDPARLAAQVTVALEFGAHVLRTVAPRPVRRSAYVIRAIEAAQ